MIRDHLDRQELLNAVRTAVREELRTGQFQTIPKEHAQAEAGDVDDNVLGFLLALQKGDDDTGWSG